MTSNQEILYCIVLTTDLFEITYVTVLRVTYEIRYKYGLICTSIFGQEKYGSNVPDVM